jgi:hypothetical protein
MDAFPASFFAARSAIVSPEVGPQRGQSKPPRFFTESDYSLRVQQ